MYAFPWMIDLGLEKGAKWASDEHRIVATNLLIGQGWVDSLDKLKEYCAIVNAVPSDKIKNWTWSDYEREQ